MGTSTEKSRDSRLVSNRRRRLRKLIDEKYGSQAGFVRTTGENQGEVSDLLKSKSFGEKKARSLEVKCGLPEGWLDVDEDAALAPPGAGTRPQPEGHAPEWMAPEAFELLTLYYSAQPDGRAEIMNTARDFGRSHRQTVIHNEA